MKRQTTFLAIGFLFANLAHAVSVDADGVGEVLLFPYYTVDGNNSTLITLQNTTDAVKAMGIRFREGRNGSDVLSFNLYLAPRDTWAAAVVSDGVGGPAAVLTTDETCTVPSVVAVSDGVPFRNFAFSGDGAGDGLDRTRSGFIEVIEMGEVAFDVSDDDIGDELGDFAIPNAEGNGQLFDCEGLVDAWSPDGVWRNEPATDMSSPAGGIVGNASIINVLAGTQFSYAATALVGFYRPSADQPVSLHARPGTETPNLTSAANGEGPVFARMLDKDGELLSASFSRGIDAVSALFMRRSLQSDFVTDPVVDGAHEWVITLPTRSSYVTQQDATAPFTSPLGAESEAGAGDARTAEPAQLGIWDRESLDAIEIAGEGSDSAALEVVTNVIEFARQADASQSTLVGAQDFLALDIQSLSSGLFNGLAEVSFTGEAQILESLEGIVFEGLPVLGISLQVARNNTLTDDQGRLVRSNYAGAVNLRSTMSVASPNSVN